MDGTRFDGLAKAVASRSASRRATLRLVGAALSGRLVMSSRPAPAAAQTTCLDATCGNGSACAVPTGSVDTDCLCRTDATGAAVCATCTIPGCARACRTNRNCHKGAVCVDGTCVSLCGHALRAACKRRR